MIYVVHHKNSERDKHNYVEILNDIKYKHIHVKCLANEYPFDSILQLHEYLNEYVVQYYAYKYELNENKEDGYIGFCHYRRIIKPDCITSNMLKHNTYVFYKYILEKYRWDCNNTGINNHLLLEHSLFYCDTKFYAFVNDILFKKYKDIFYNDALFLNIAYMREIYTTNNFEMFATINNIIIDYILWIKQLYEINNVCTFSLENSIQKYSENYYTDIVFNPNLRCEWAVIFWNRIIAYNIEILIAALLVHYTTISDIYVMNNGIEEIDTDTN